MFARLKQFSNLSHSAITPKHKHKIDAMQVRSDAAEDAEGGFFTPPRRGAGTNKDAQEKNNGNARFSDTDSDDLSIDTGKARPYRAGRAD